ncbi:MAG: phosphoribosyltransferase [Candidatus Thorarchaeota archaeon]
METSFSFVWWERLYELCFRLYEKIHSSDFVPDVIIGIARGGWVPARVLSDLFFMNQTANVKVDLYRGIFAQDEGPKVSQSIPEGRDWTNPLVVDDVSDSGESMIAALEHLRGRGLSNMKTACLHMKPGTDLVPDFYVEKTRSWIVYPWELKEFVFTYASQIAGEDDSLKDIEQDLLDLHLPLHYVRFFLKQLENRVGRNDLPSNP